MEPIARLLLASDDAVVDWEAGFVQGSAGSANVDSATSVRPVPMPTTPCSGSSRFSEAAIRGHLSSHNRPIHVPAIQACCCSKQLPGSPGRALPGCCSLLLLDAPDAAQESTDVGRCNSGAGMQIDADDANIDATLCTATQS